MIANNEQDKQLKNALPATIFNVMFFYLIPELAIPSMKYF